MRAALILALGASAFVLAAAMPAAAANPARDRPDETALRYYASQKNTARVEAESERLRRRHPGWHPPADLWTAEPGGEDEGALWDLFGADRLAELRKAIDERMRTEQGWSPSTPLARALAQRELRLEAVGLTKAGRWADMAALADKSAAALDVGESELLLSAAEAWGRTERGPEAFALLQRLMRAPRFGSDERRGAVLRAMAFLSMGEIDRLIALGRPGDVDAIRIDLIRGRISAILHDEAGQSVSADDLSAFEAIAEASTDPNQPALVAWLAYKGGDFPKALDWFKRAIARGGDAMVAHGLAHTLRQLGLKREAEDVAYAWREPLVNNTLLFIDLLETDLTREIPPAIEPERLKRYAQVTATVASGEGAQALAWYAYNNCQFDTALDWFKRAVAWYPKEATVYGYALTLRRLRQQRNFIEAVNRYDGLFPKVVDLLFEPARDDPMPCEQTGARPVAQPREAAQTSAYLDLARPEPVMAQQRGRVPGPQDLGAGANAELPRIRRTEFPIAVLMENDLRVAPTGGGEIADSRWTGRLIGRPPVVARRVPGVGTMPYERYGFSLKPAYSGEESASSPTAAEKPAPIGTLWSDMHRTAPMDTVQPAAVERAPSAPADIDETGSIPSKNRSNRRTKP